MLDFRVRDVPELIDSYSKYGQMGDEKRPFRPDEQLSSILKAIHDQLKNLGFARWLILVDEIDGEMYHHVDALAMILRPLINTLALFRMSLIWKFFLPHELREIVGQSLPRLRGQLEIADIVWSKRSGPASGKPIIVG